LGLDGTDDFAEYGEVSVVQALPPGELPNPFDRIQVWAVGWQIIQGESVCMFLPPRSVKPGMMILGIVGDHDDPSSSSSTRNFFKEPP
jgi:hypothetical protein